MNVNISKTVLKVELNEYIIACKNAGIDMAEIEKSLVEILNDAGIKARLEE